MVNQSEPSSQEINICLSQLPTYEAGAVLFSWLAFPEAEDGAEERRGEVHAALCNRLLHAMAEADDTWKWSPQLIKPGYALLPEEAVRTATKTMDRRLRDRLNAAVVVKPYLQHAATGEAPRLPPGVKRLSLSSMADFVQTRTDRGPGSAETKNFHGRVWQASQPVIHLAAALDALFDEYLKMGGIGKLSIYDLLLHPECIEFLVKGAQYYEKLLLGHPEPHISNAKLIQFRLT